MKAYLCDGCKKAPAAFKARLRLSPYFENDDAIAKNLGDFCKECAKKQFPEHFKK